MSLIDIRKKGQNAFAKALAHGERGDKILYFTGPHCGGPHRYDAAKAQEEGQVSLVQKRTAPKSSMFDYLAQIR